MQLALNINELRYFTIKSFIIQTLKIHMIYQMYPKIKGD